MKNLPVVVTVALLLLCFGAMTASAAGYVAVNAGAVFVEDADTNLDTEVSFDTGAAITAAVGGVADSGARGEIELSYRTSDIDDIEFVGSVDGDVTALAMMANGYYHFSSKSAVSPFVGAGIGFANIEGDIDNFGSEDDTVFAYQASAGVSFVASENVNIDLQYRYFATEDPDFDGLEAEYTTHNAMLGLRYSF